ncbi:MAG: Flp family type IVb pilin [Amaricoccus sp.]
MKYTMNIAQRLWRDEDGATAIEYGLLAALIAVVIIAAVTTLGSTVKSTFTEVNDKMVDGSGIGEKVAGK